MWYNKTGSKNLPPKGEVMDGDLTSKSGLEGLRVEFDASAKPYLTVDVERYQAYLDGIEMTNAQKEEFLQSMWQIIVSFVELGFGVHPLQEVCGKDEQSTTQSAVDAFDAVHSDQPKDENKEQDPRP
jgi:hypothetical protein